MSRYTVADVAGGAACAGGASPSGAGFGKSGHARLADILSYVLLMSPMASAFGGTSPHASFKASQSPASLRCARRFQPMMRPSIAPTPHLTPPPQRVNRFGILGQMGQAREHGNPETSRVFDDVGTGAQFVLGENVGNGNFGHVYACVRPDGSHVAVKKMAKSKLLTLKTITRLSSELRILREHDHNRRHANILYIDNVLHSRSHVYIIMPLGGKVSLIGNQAIALAGLRGEIFKGRLGRGGSRTVYPVA